MDTKVICLTAVRNERWVLEKFLQSASAWADHIIIADQMSTDGSREIALRFPKVILIDNEAAAHDQGARQRLLLDAARKIPGPRLLIALDADELLAPDAVQSPEWQTLLRAPPGTAFTFEWFNLMPGLQECWSAGHFQTALMDDGSADTAALIHSARMPAAPDADVIRMNHIKVVHLQFTDWQRMESKHRWYQCFELLNDLHVPLDIYRIYHHMYAGQRYQPVPAAWLAAWRSSGHDITSTLCEARLWWDVAVLDWMAEHGPEKFRRLDIWRCDWDHLAAINGLGERAKIVSPQRRIDRWILRYLARTQSWHGVRSVRLRDALLRRFYR